MNQLDGVWTLIGGRAFDENGKELEPPYDAESMGSIVIRDGRMLVSLCRGPADPVTGKGHGFSSYGGPFTFDGKRLKTHVEMASEPERIGGIQARDVTLAGEHLTLRPPTRAYGARMESREVYWQRVGPAKGY